MTYQYKYVDAIATEVPRRELSSMRDQIGVGNITKDEIIPLPSSVDTLHRSREDRGPGALVVPRDRPCGRLSS